MGGDKMKALQVSVLTVFLPLLIYLPLEALGFSPQLAGQFAGTFTVFVLVACIASQACNWFLGRHGPHAEIVILSATAMLLLCLADRWSPGWIAPISVSSLSVLAFECCRYRIWEHKVC
jgi:hypothetical protein